MWYRSSSTVNTGGLSYGQIMYKECKVIQFNES